MGKTVTYLLSWPPSTNDLWRAVNGRNILSRRARAWAETAGKEVLAQGLTTFPGPVTVDIDLQSPFRRPYDPDNRVKAVMDLLVKCAIIEGDSDRQVHRITVSTQESGFVGARVTITLVEGEDGDYFHGG